MFNKKVNRRNFFALFLVLIGSVGFFRWLFSRFIEKAKRPRLYFAENHAAVGHKIRLQLQPAKSVTSFSEVAIIGGGVAGLSAARYLSKKGVKDIVLLELVNNCGGNSQSGENSVSKYPWGAHYVPIPSLNQPDLIDFFTESNIVVNSVEGVPVYNEYFLCHQPEERLFIKGFWQNGIIPSTDLSEEEQNELERFLETMDVFQKAIGIDGLGAFEIPIALSSKDQQFRSLDEITMYDWLVRNNFNSEKIHWYIDYCTRDDYGTSYKETSAWAGIHYFASRKGKGANTQNNQVLTWPEGNGFIIEQLKAQTTATIATNSLVFKVEQKNEKWVIHYLNTVKNEIVAIESKYLVAATPRFINTRIFSEDLYLDKNQPEYAPWIIANITLKDQLNQNFGAKLSWDNVIYGTNSLGYVNAGHQSLSMHKQKTVLTWYRPLANLSTEKARAKLYNTEVDEWYDEMIQELSKVHLDIESKIEEVAFWRWGHAMPKPKPGFIDNKPAINNEIKNLFFAHSDLSGISIFEEAFYQGTKAAKQIVQNIGLNDKQ